MWRLKIDLNFEEEKTERKDKGISLKAKMQRVKLESRCKELAKPIAQLTRNLGQVMKVFNRSSNGGVPRCVPDTLHNTRNYNSPRKNEAVEASSYSRNMGSWI